MVCKNCTATIPDDSVFCPSCGRKLETDPVEATTFSFDFRQAGNSESGKFGIEPNMAEETPAAVQEDNGSIVSAGYDRADGADPVSEPVAAPADSEWYTFNGSASPDPQANNLPNRCLHCGAPLDPYAVFCSSCGKRQYVASANNPYGTKKSGTIIKVIIAAASVALLLGIFLIIGFAANWFGITKPASQIVSAVENTFNADNFTADFKYTYSSYRGWSSEVKGKAYISVDPDKRKLTVYAEVTANKESGIIAIYDGCYITESSGKYHCEDISEQLDKLFDSYEDDEEFSWEDFINGILGKGAYDELEEDIDFDKLTSCLKEYAKKLNNKKWLEENAGYSVKKNDGVTLHRFEPDIHNFLKASAAEFESAFIDDDLWDEMNDSISDLRSGSKLTNTEIVFGIKSRKLVHFEYKFTGSYDSLTSGNEYRIKADFYDIGKTKIDTEEMEDLLAMAKKNR